MNSAVLFFFFFLLIDKMANLRAVSALAVVAFASLTYSSPAGVVSMTTGRGTAVKPVNMTVYYESLCPGCNYYIHKTLAPLWPKIKDLDLMTVNLLPFGNAEEKKLGFKWLFHCQHGAAECQGNTVQACLIHYHADTTKQLQVVDCFFTDFIHSIGIDWKQSLKNCSHTGIDVEKIETCAAGQEGMALQHEIAEVTGPHGYTPYIMLDGVPNKPAEDYLLEEICKVYTGPKPDICMKGLV